MGRRAALGPPGPWPPVWPVGPWRGTRADGSKEQLFERVLAGAEASRVDEVSERFARHHLSHHLRADVRGAVRVAPPPAATGWSSCRPPLRCTSGWPGSCSGADGVIATRLAVDGHGRLTGRYEGANCRGQEKLRRLRAWMEEVGARPDRLWAYGNSRGDLRMLEAADVGVNVGRLGRLGRLRAHPGLDGTPPAGEGAGTDRSRAAAATGSLTPRRGHADPPRPAVRRQSPVRGTPSCASTPARTNPRWAAGRR